MKPRFFVPVLLAASLCTSCALGPTVGTPSTRSMPAARAALLPEHRIFYDALVDYGDWILIEPYGYLFRPSVDFHTWRPYEVGFWAPSDSYGWVWISSESFGWATYHYGRWFRDELRGWVWKPGSQWGPAWVGWQANDQYVGWSPLAPGATTSGSAAAESFVYASVDQMGTPDLQVFRARELGEAVSNARPADNRAVVEGVEMFLGPSIERIERLKGRALPRVQIEDLVRDREWSGEVPAKSGAGAQATPPAVTLEDTRQAGAEVTRTARSLRGTKGELPGQLPVVRPVGVPIQTRRPAAADTASSRRGR